MIVAPAVALSPDCLRRVSRRCPPSRGARKPRRSAPARGFGRCSARPRRWRRRRASSSSSCASSKSSVRSRSKSSPESTGTSRRRPVSWTRSAARAEALRKVADADRPDIEARLVQLYKLGRAGYWRLLLDVDDLRSLGRAYRTAAAMTHLDRERIQRISERSTRSPTSADAAGSHRVELAELEEKATRRRARRSIARCKAARRWSRRSTRGAISTRSGPASCEAAQQRLQSSVAALDGAAPRSRSGRFKARCPGPCAARSLAVRPSTEQPVRHRHRPQRHRDRCAEGQPVRAVHEGAGRVRRPVHRLRQPRDRRARRARVLALRPPERPSGRAGRRVEAQAPLGRSGLNPNGVPALYFELRVDGKPVDPLQWLQKGNP